MSEEPGAELDRDRIERLTGQILLAIRENYVAGPVSRDRVYEALNALAFSTAWVIRGTGDPEALEWFSKALNTNLHENTDHRDPQ
jgi:hypothetical protein